MSYEKLGFVSGQTLKAEHLNHMEEGIVNISWNDLADKPFEETEAVVNFVPDGVTYSEDDGAFIGTAAAIPTVGETYAVTWNGTKYDAIAVGIDGDGVVCLGNLAVLGAGEDTGEPFGVVFYIQEMLVLCVSLGDSQEANLEIKGISKTIKKLDEKFYVSPCIYYFDSLSRGDKYLYSDPNHENKVNSMEFAESKGRVIVLIDQYEGQFYPMGAFYAADDYSGVHIPVAGRSESESVASIWRYTAEYQS